MNQLDLNTLLRSGKKTKEAISFAFGETITSFIAQDSANKLDSREQEIVGTITDTMQKALDNSKFKRLRKQLGKYLSLSGYAALSVDIINGEPFISVSEKPVFKEVAGKLIEVVLSTANKVVIDNTSYDLYERYFLSNGRVIKENGISTDKDGWVVQGEQIILPANITRIPVKIFANNEDLLSDIDNVRMGTAIKQLSKMYERLPNTMELSQIGLLVNRNMSGGKSAKDILKEYRDTGTIEVNGMDSQLGAGIQPIGSMGYSIELIAVIDWLEDKIFKFTFTTRDTTSSGTNKHNAEIGMFNQFAIEYLIDKKEIREEDYADFYSILSMMSGTPTQYTVTLKISEVLQNMLDSMNPETPEVSEIITEDNKQKEGEV